MANRIPIVNGSDAPLGYLEPLDPNADSVAANGFYLQATAGTTSGDTTVGIIRDASGNMQLFDAYVSKTLSQLSTFGPTGPAGATGARGSPGVTGPTSTLQLAYNAGGSVGPRRINVNPTQGGIYIQEPSGGVSGGILFRIESSVTAGPTAYFEVTPTGILTSGQLSGRRIDLNGTPLAPTDFSLSRLGSGGSAGNGPQYGVTNISGDDSHGIFTVMSAITGYTGNPTVILNFKDGPRANTPFVVSKLTAPMNPTNAAPKMHYGTSLIETTISPTNIQWQFNGTPSARCYFTIEFIAIA